MGGRGAGNEADERIIGTRLQQTRNGILSGLLIFYCYGEMQWCGLIELVDWVYVAVFVSEDVFKHIDGGIFGSITGLSRALDTGHRVRESHARCRASSNQRRQSCVQPG